MTLVHPVLVATPTSASQINNDSLEMLQAFLLNDLPFSIKHEGNGALLVFTRNKSNHEKLESEIDKKFPNLFRTQEIPKKYLH